MFTCPKCSKEIPKWKSAMVGAQKISCDNCGSILQPTKNSQEKLEKMTSVGVVFGVGAAAYAVNFGNCIGVIVAFTIICLLACVVVINITEFEVVDS